MYSRFAVPSLLAVCTIIVSGLVVASARALPDGAALLANRESLGRLLFWDPILSGEMDTACATCHHPDFAYSDGRSLPIGVGGAGLGPDRVDASGGRIPVVNRNAPTILNVAFNGLQSRRGRRATGANLAAVDQARAPMFWDSRVRSLEAQALEPIRAREEMRGDAYAAEVAVDSVVARLRAIPEYVALFEAAFPGEGPITSAQLAGALAAFQRTLVALNSPFDRFQAGDREALTPQQRRGLDTFNRVGCDECHSGPLFTDFELHTLGVADNAALAAPDMGADGRFRFRTPSLRNVALTAPYMHSGVFATLEEVLEFYDNGRSENPLVATGGGQRRGRGSSAGTVAQVDGDFRRIDNLSNREIADIIAFLESLTDDTFDRTVPASVPSGLPPGGNIGVNAVAGAAAAD
ncbi:MAG TPA: cytochrome c peroxidase [Longimicrobiales bacterium]|nr:cytochrome c peroxidase [Longimicrobiales bacterium]